LVQYCEPKGRLFPSPAIERVAGGGIFFYNDLFSEIIEKLVLSNDEIVFLLEIRK